MKIRKFNEKIEPGHMTLQYLFDSAEQTVGIDLNNERDLDWIQKYYDLEKDFTFSEHSLVNFDGGYFIWPANSLNFGFLFVYIGDNDTPKAIIYVGELFNPFAFKNMIICPGRDYVVAYDWQTGEHKKHYIR